MKIITVNGGIARSVFAALGVCAVMAAPTATAQQLDPINVLVVDERNTLVYPAYAGIELGFYEAEGLDVTLLPSETTVPFVAFLSNGDADLVMLDAAETLQAVIAGHPVSVVYEVNQFAPEAIGVMLDSPIKGLADLKGKTVGLASDRDRTTTMVALETVGLSIDDVSTVVIGESGPLIAKSLRDGTIDAYAGAASELAAAEANGIPVRNITPQEVSENPGNNFVMWSARKDELDDVVARFLRAYTMATHAGVIDTKAMASVSRKYLPEQWEDVDIGMSVLEFAVYKTNLVRTVKRGELQPNVWERIQGGYARAGIGEVGAPIDPLSFLDDSFIDRANNYTTDDVKAAIAEWKRANADILVP